MNIKQYTKEKYLNSLSINEKSAITFYCEKGYDINILLRNDDTSKVKYRNIINNLDSAIDKFNNKSKLKLYRKLDIIYDEELTSLIKKWEKEKIIFDRAYMSTSIDMNAYKIPYNILLEIDFPKGGKGAYIDHFSEFHEEEFLLGRNCKLDITDITTDIDCIFDTTIYKVKTKFK